MKQTATNCWVGLNLRKKKENHYNGWKQVDLKWNKHSVVSISAAMENKNQRQDQPEEVPKEAMSWSNRSKTDNSKSEAMGLGRGRDNGLQLLALSAMAVVATMSASISVCKQGALAEGQPVVVVGCSANGWWLFRLWWLPVSFKWEGRFLTRLTVTMLLDALVFEFSSSDGSIRSSGLVEAASMQFKEIKKNNK